MSPDMFIRGISGYYKFEDQNIIIKIYLRPKLQASLQIKKSDPTLQAWSAKHKSGPRREARSVNIKAQSTKETQLVFTTHQAHYDQFSLLFFTCRKYLERYSENSYRTLSEKSRWCNQ